jgi:hypothetical protein
MTQNPILKTFFTFCLAALFFIQAKAGQTNIPIHGDWVFEQNNGQFSDLSTKEAPYVGMDGNVNLLFYRDRIRFIFSHTTSENGQSEAGAANAGPMRQHLGTEPEKLNTQTETVDMLFTGANTNAEITASGLTPFTKNYYFPHCPAGITDVKTYDKLTYRNLYPNIDFVIYSRAHGLKYEFVVHPGGNPQNIKISWPGAAITGTGSKLEYSNPLGSIKESGLYTYLSSGKKVKSAFSLNKGITSFALGKYPKDQTLTIDPYLEWATYYGGSDYEFDPVVDVDSFGNVYMAGNTKSKDYIASAGAWQKTNPALSIYLVKFSKDGTRLWGTFYGGDQAGEIAVGMAVSASGSVYVVGGTHSDTGIATAGAYRSKKNSGEDAFLSKFSSKGKLEWGTYYGGRHDDVAGAIALSGNIIYVGGATSSTDSIATIGTNQSSRGGGDFFTNDGFLAKFDTLGNRLWGTYYGGDNYDWIMDIAIAPNGDPGCGRYYQQL